MSKIGLKIPEKVLRNWDMDPNNILGARYKYRDEGIFKFSYHPVSGEFLFAIEPTPHNMMVANSGSYSFKEYIRGINFHRKNTVYLRMHDNKEWLEQTKKMLREHGLPSNVRIVWGEDAAHELREDLKGL